MPSLSKELRRLLEKTIAGENGARHIAELGAEQSLRRLAVDRPEPHTSLTPEERTLRTQLRAHGRQLGDKLDLQRGSQSIDHLKQAVAYEHWHRLLFARFLAENDLLMHPEHDVALSLDEVKEAALELGRDWIDVASQYAHRMLLREVFRSDDPALSVPLSPERRLELEKKLNSLSKEVFLADDSLGWVYQFWQKDAKDQVNRSEAKIGADELSPVTQLFTEDYMVLFLLENTLGAWWTAQRGKPDLPGYQWTYLRLADDGSPEAGGFEGWPQVVEELRILDPSMGSGHFLTFALPILAHMRAEQESITLKDAIFAVLRDNIFGLELDQRCSQIAAFNLAQTAWKLAGTHFDLPILNLACSGLGINAKEDDWVKLAGNDALAGEGMRRLYSLFRDAPTLGSLIDPLRLKANVYAAGAERVLPLIERALATEEFTDENRELAIAAQGLIAAFRILSSTFTLVATNVPYLGRAKQSPLLAQYCAEFHKDAKSDLATSMADRCLSFASNGGTCALVTTQTWLYLGPFEALRRRLLRSLSWNFVVHLGEHAFESSQAAGAFVAMVVLTKVKPNENASFASLDVLDESTPMLKQMRLVEAVLQKADQAAQLSNPDARVAKSHRTEGLLLESFARSYKGISTGDLMRFNRCFWEVLELGPSKWNFLQGAVTSTMPYGARNEVVLWENGLGSLYQYVAERLGESGVGAWIRGAPAWGMKGVATTQMRELPSSIYTGELFDENTAAIVPLKPEYELPIWAFCSSPAFRDAVRRIDQSLKVPTLTLLKVPFDLEYWQGVAAERFPDGLPEPVSRDPTQWLFDGSPKGSQNPLQVAAARLVGYRWPRQLGVSFPGSPSVAPDALEALAARDGIVCLSSVAGEENASTRLRLLLQTAFAEDYNLTEILLKTKSKTLDGWMRDEFFEEHCRLFGQVPFIWHVWDGLKDGFHAFINYQMLDRRNMEKLIYSYLGDWIARQRQDVQNGVDGSDMRLASAEHLQGELKQLLEGEKPYDIFVRWKPLNRQPIGWDPDLDDGIRMNIRPWILTAKLYKSAKPGILRVTPNIRYTKDRGKEPERDPKKFPWFAGMTDRINDHHLSLAEKRRARGSE